MARKIKAVIFDMDGVLADTMPLLFLAWKKTINEIYGKTFSKKFFIEKVSARRAPEALAFILKKKVSEAEAEKVQKIKAEYFKELFQKDMKEIVGVKKYLQFIITPCKL